MSPYRPPSPNCRPGTASISFITSAEGGYVFTSLRSVCLSVCLSVRRITDNGFLRNFLEGRACPGPGTNEFNFGDDPDHRPDPGVGSPKSAFTELSKKLPTDFYEILWKAGVWPRDQLITFIPVTAAAAANKTNIYTYRA